ncbi:hypothetical protein CANARDRAFT_5610 [[Candida] arabinofermentans NRRL YB-2248]|uniref:GAF domain-containing protein n=1 Tax=[Candida] arabinofermentans NRRL YB-2248 TaxID=983967 RepID=A0A1E4T5Q7_9ASCO|nr:hypothetical protein CANARDRAFT_5610 [[Candida] arabinofermentans NRRL YB-2248]
MSSENIKHHADYANFSASTTSTKKDILEQLLISYEALTIDQTNWVCNLANCSSLLWYSYLDGLSVPVNWCGFYLVDEKDTSQLILGPFMGKVACQTIKIGKGVCGVAADKLQTQVVPDVELYPGHIACDGETKSEIVVPLVDSNGKVKGVLDIDCLAHEGFDEFDKEMLEKLAKMIVKSCDW